MLEGPEIIVSKFKASNKYIASRIADIVNKLQVLIIEQLATSG